MRAKRRNFILSGIAMAAFAVLVIAGIRSSGTTMGKYKPIIERIARQTETTFRPASATSLSQLRDLKFPAPIVAFYAQYEPEHVAEDRIRFWPISDIVVENTQAVPGICVVPFGYIVFASTACGDAYCLNLNRCNSDGEPEIVLISHEAVDEDAKADQVHRVAKPVARTFLEFLERFSKREVDEECIY